MRKEIKKEFVSEGQKECLYSYYEYKDKIYRIEIEIDTSYNFQSRANSFLFTDNGWKQVYFIPYSELLSIGYGRSCIERRSSMNKDEFVLIGYTEKILDSILR
jgi:hypothetical protein